MEETEVKEKKIQSYQSNTVRELVSKLRELNIPREDIVTILQRDEYIYAIYYK